MRIVLLSNHWLLSPGKAGFHHLASALHSMGHEVTFAATGLSFISYARRDQRTRNHGLWAARGRLEEIKPGLFSYVHFTPWHPHTLMLPWLDKLVEPLMDRYADFPLGPLEEKIRAAEAIIYESCSALFLANKCKKLAPDARHIYRASDDVRVMRSAHPRLASLEKEVCPLFDLISVPCAYLLEKFHGEKNVQLHKHGIDKAAFDAARKSPYSAGKNNCVFTGKAFLDQDFLRHAANGNPKVDFHILGSFPKEVKSGNVHYHGEMPFKDSVAFVKFAQAGLHNLCKSRASASFTDSLKILQYRYCGLPIISPEYLNLSREGVFYYRAEDEESCVASVRKALDYGIHENFAAEARSWAEVAGAVVGW